MHLLEGDGTSLDLRCDTEPLKGSLLGNTAPQECEHVADRDCMILAVLPSQDLREVRPSVICVMPPNEAEGCTIRHVQTARMTARAPSDTLSNFALAAFA